MFRLVMEDVSSSGGEGGARRLKLEKGGEVNTTVEVWSLTQTLKDAWTRCPDLICDLLSPTSSSLTNAEPTASKVMILFSAQASPHQKETPASLPPLFVIPSLTLGPILLASFLPTLSSPICPNRRLHSLQWDRHNQVWRNSFRLQDKGRRREE